MTRQLPRAAIWLKTMPIALSNTRYIATHALASERCRTDLE